MATKLERGPLFFVLFAASLKNEENYATFYNNISEIQYTQRFSLDEHNVGRDLDETLGGGRGALRGTCVPCVLCSV